jgi:uncharacterized protein YggE
MRLIIISCLGLLLFQRMSAEPELKGSPAELAAYLPSLSRSVSITGEGEVKVPADRAIITLKVTTETKSLADALRMNEEIRGKLTGFLKDHGIGPEHIQTSRFSSTPKYSVLSEKVKSQRVENLIKVTAHNEKEFQTVAAAPDKFAEVSYVTVDFEHSDKESFRAKAAAEACDIANSRKKVFEERLGLKLIPKRFIEGNPPAGPAMTRAGIQAGTAPSFGGVTAIPFEPAIHALDVSPQSVSAFGELVFKVVVTVEYAAETK